MAYHSENYKGKNPISRSQWRRQQRQRKAEREDVEQAKPESSRSMTLKPEKKQEKKEEKKSVERKLFSPQEKVSAVKSDHDEYMIIDDFDSNSYTSLEIACNVVSVLPREYDEVMEVEEPKDMGEIEMAKHKLVCYYIMNNGCVEERNTFFERPDESMKSHLKPLFIRGKMENVGVNKILVDGEAIMNLIPNFMLKWFGKYDTDTKPHNMVLSNYEGKVRTRLGVIH